jgi:hypothetical protein
MGRDAWQIARAADVIERSVAPPRSERVTTGVTKCVTRKIFAAEMAQAQAGDPAQFMATQVTTIPVVVAIEPFSFDTLVPWRDNGATMLVAGARSPWQQLFESPYRQRLFSFRHSLT